MTPIEANKALVRRYIEEGLNAADPAVIAELLVPDGLCHGPAQFAARPASAVPMSDRAPEGLPPLIIEHMVADGDKVATRAVRGPLYSASTDEMRGGAEDASQGPVTVRSSVYHTTVFIHRLEGDKIVEEWRIEDIRAVGSHF